MNKQTIINKARGYSPIGAEAQAFIDGAEWAARELDAGELYEVKWQGAQGIFGVFENVGYVIADNRTAVDAKFGHLVGYTCRFLGSNICRLSDENAADFLSDRTEIKK